MENQGVRLKKFISKTPYNQKEFAELIGVAPNYISMMIKGTKPITDNFLLNIIKVIPDADISSISNNKIFKKSDVKIVNDENEADIFINKNDVKFMIYDDDTIKVEVDMMPFRAYASSDIDCYFDKEYRENEFNKAIFTVDRVAKGLYLGFKSQNDSMNGGGIYDTPSNAELLCRELGRHLWDKLHGTEYGLVLMTKTAILHKDITNYNKDTGMFTLHSRNPNVEDFEEHINNVYRIFRVVKRTF